MSGPSRPTSTVIRPPSTVVKPVGRNLETSLERGIPDQKRVSVAKSNRRGSNAITATANISNGGQRRDYHEVALAALTNDFLNVADISLDLRAYLVETTIPTIVMALEKLLREADRRGFVENMTATFHSGSKLSLLKNVDHGGLEDEEVAAPAAEQVTLDRQIDKPERSIFDPINWLAQCLYRNNPRYHEMGEITSSPYHQQMNLIMNTLNSRLFEMQMNAKAQKRAHDLARKREEERQIRAQSQKMEERKALFEQLLSTIFKKWTNKLWRLANGYILKDEMISAYKHVLGSNSIQANDNMITKVTNLLKFLTMSAAAAERAKMRSASSKASSKPASKPTSATPAQASQPNEGSADSESSAAKPAAEGTEQAPAQGQEQPPSGEQQQSQPPREEEQPAETALPPEEEFQSLPPEFLTLERWDLPFYREGMMMLTFQCKWSIDELGAFLQSLSGRIDELGESLLSAFNEAFVMPKFTAALRAASAGATAIGVTAQNQAAKENWRQQLKKMVHGFEVSDPRLQSPFNEALKGTLLDYCSGNVTLEQLGVSSGSSVARDKDPAVTVIVATESPPGSAAGGTGTGEQPETPSNLVSAWDQGILDAEVEFKKFMKVMVGNYGLQPMRLFSAYVQRKAMEDGLLPPDTVLMNETGPTSAGGGTAAATGAIGGKPAEGPLTITVKEMETRTAILRSLFLLIDESGEGLADIKRLNELFNSAAKVISPLDPSIAAHLLTLLFPTSPSPDDPNITKTKLSVEEFTSHILDKCISLSKKTFNELTDVIKQVFEIGAESQRKLAKEKADALLAAGKQAELPMDRVSVQRRALDEIRELGHRHDLNVANIADGSLKILSSAFKSIHPKNNIMGRVTLSETAVTSSGDSPTTEEPASPGVSVIENFLRFIATTDELKDSLLGTKISTDYGFEAQVMKSDKPVKIDNASEDPSSPSSLFAPGSPLMSPGTVARFLGVPFISQDENKKPVGVLGLTMASEDPEGFNEPDVHFVEAATSAMITAFNRADARQKAISLAESSLYYARSKGDAEVEIYLNEPDTWKEPPKFFKVEDDDGISDHDKENLVEGAMASPYMRPVTPRVTPVDPESALNDLLTQTAHTKDMIDHSDTDGRTSTYIPIVDEEHHVVAVMVVRPHTGVKGGIPDDDLAEVKRVVHIMEAAVNQIHKEKFGQESLMHVLEGEKIDESTRRKLFFSKMMLLSARDSLAKLDNRAISELKSYKKPPPTIHRVLKAVLYIFGKLPKEVKKWSDTVKMITLDLLKQMIAYDPTAIQKKIRFKRCSRVLKLIPHGDVKNRGSLPAMHMYDWLIVSLDLRERALEARKRRPEIFSMMTESDVGEDGAESENEDELDDSSSSTASTVTYVEGSDFGGKPASLRSAGSKGSLLAIDDGADGNKAPGTASSSSSKRVQFAEKLEHKQE
ncbi:EF-hand calcium-binding domain-containing protein 5 [Blyttiomyces sp. JEL0837]|nr:EF-hand calcium-binding domain-containing protein 5 [Blyttiomyces sp. JEL0837]